MACDLQCNASRLENGMDSMWFRVVRYSITIGAMIGILALPTAFSSEKASGSPEKKKEPEYQTEFWKGKVVWLAATLKDEFEISAVPEAAERILALQTKEGDIFPILEDVRGRSFRIDKRLRGQDMELMVRRHKKHPMLQVLRVYEWKDNKKYEVDYWCDICAIIMFEMGPCACCQDDNRLRKRLVPGDAPNSK